MSGRGAEQSRSSRPPQQPRDEDEDDFYDCQETLEPPEGGGASREEGGVSRDEGGVSREEGGASREEGGVNREEGGVCSQMNVEQEAVGMKDCQFNMSRRNDSGGERQVLQEDRLQEDRLQEELQGDRLQDDRLQGDRLEEELQGDRLQDDRLEEELQGDRLQCDRLQDDRLEEELQGDRLQEDSDWEMKEGVGPAVEFDDDYLREVEKELTEEEKESRRQQSLTLKEEGNSQFKAGDWLAAGRSYTEALVLCPVCFSRERAVLFSNRAAARLHLDLKDQAISDCSRAIELNPEYLRALLRRAELYEQTEKLDEALEDYKKVLDRDPNHPGARQACMRLPQQIQERNEKLKEEMISKLKDLGNMILRPFGLSTNNFQVNQDSSSGSYSINFVQNPGNR